ncbi:hypothetical protein DPEC_G00146630 [Dallia pectoralis]|uniref:Uncharacterized protein n=1 Tax=Dallia pectoralis TaxID=75939 RepID=A0ACC2GPK7_DALPE|nr:hypothetical protein DPEC_G00146630 [Dallia pectoralis]
MAYLPCLRTIRHGSKGEELGQRPSCWSRSVPHIAHRRCGKSELATYIKDPVEDLLGGAWKVPECVEISPDGKSGELVHWSGCRES